MPASLPDFSTIGMPLMRCACHQLQRLGQRRVGRHGDRVDHHPALEPLDRRTAVACSSMVEVAVKHADAAELGQRDRHVGLGHGVHRRGQDRDVERNAAGEPGAGVGLARQDRGFERLQQDVVERQSRAGCRRISEAELGWAISAHDRAGAIRQVRRRSDRLWPRLKLHVGRRQLLLPGCLALGGSLEPPIHPHLLEIEE